MAFGPTGDATCLRLCARLSIPANARACPHIKPSRRPFRLSALCSNRVEQLPITFPAPVDTRLHDVVRNSLDVHQVVHEDVARLRLHRRHTDTAIAHHYRGHAVPWGTGEERIPGD